MTIGSSSFLAARQPCWTSVIVSLLLGAIPGCGDEPRFELEASHVQRFVEERCAGVEQCCNSLSRSDCEDVETRTLAELEADVDAPLTFSKECYDQIVAQAGSAGCDSDVGGCQLAHGSGQPGDACTSVATAFYFADSCSTGHRCREGRCVEEPFVAIQGADEGDRCSPFELCDSGLFCNEEQLCAVEKPLGASCTHLRECEGGNRTFCDIPADDEVGVCAEGRPRGEACVGRHQCGVECDENGSCTKLTCFEEICQSQPPAVCLVIE